MRVPTTSPAGPSGQVSMRKRETEAMAGMASPRNPMVAMAASPPASRSLEVACRSRERSASSRAMPVPVVGDPDERQAALLEVDLDVPGPGVEGVLEQLLHHGGGALDHLAGGDLVRRAPEEGPG